MHRNKSPLNTREGRVLCAAVIRTATSPLVGRRLTCIACLAVQVWSVSPKLRDRHLACFACGAKKLRRREMTAAEVAAA